MIRVGVAGAGGRMGSEVCAAVGNADDITLVAGVDPSIAGERIGNDVSASETIDALDPSAVDVIVDFTHLDVSREVLTWCAANGVHAVSGVTGWNDTDFDHLRSTFTDSNALIAPNFAIGAVMMMRMAELAAPHFQTAEVIEFHHNSKRDAPSGTAMMTAKRIDAARSASGSDFDADPTEQEVVAGARGGKVGRVGVHGVRMHGMVAHQEVIFGTTGETLTIRHDSIHRSSFMPGVLLGVRAVHDRPGLTLGLDDLLFGDSSPGGTPA